MRKNINNLKWKSRFFILLAANFIVIFILALLLFWPSPRTELPETTNKQTEQSSEFIIRTTKKNLNELVNAYLEKMLKGTKHHYTISLEDDVHLLGELPVFSSTVPLSIHLEPLVTNNGDVILKQKSISIGLLQLPNRKIMEYVNKYLPMPEWVTVNPKEEEIYVAVSDMKIKSNFQVSVEHIDLEANNIAFKIKVPYETLGIEPY